MSVGEKNCYLKLSSDICWTRGLNHPPTLSVLRQRESSLECTRISSFQSVMLPVNKSFEWYVYREFPAIITPYIEPCRKSVIFLFYYLTIYQSVVHWMFFSSHIRFGVLYRPRYIIPMYTIIFFILNSKQSKKIILDNVFFFGQTIFYGSNI